MIKIKDRLNWIHPTILPKESRLRLCILLFTIITTNIIVMIETVGSSLNLSVIQGYLAASSTKAVWINNCFLIFLGMFVPVAIYTARKFGFKLMFFIGLFVFFLGSLLSGLATNYYEYLSFRAISGIGGGLVFPISLAILKRAFHGQAQKIVLTLYVGLAFGGGLIIGSIVGGVYGQDLAWRSIHFLCFYLGLPSLFLIIAFMNETSRYPTDRFDFFSFICFALLLISMLTILSEAKASWNAEGWRSLFIKGCFLCLALSLTLLIVRYFHAKAPLFALSLFKNIDFSIACLCMSFVGVMFFGSNLVMMTLLEDLFQYERLRIGFVIAGGFGVTYIFFSALPSFLGNKISSYFFVVCGLFFLAFSSFLNHSLTLQSSLKDIFLLLILRAAGVGISLGPLTAMTLRNIPDDLTGQAAAMATIFRQVGGAFGSSAISLIATMRTSFHDARFGEQVNIYSAKFQDYVRDFKLHAINNTSKDYQEALNQTKKYLINNIHSQSVLASYDDSFYIFGWIFIFLIILVLIAAYLSKRKKVLSNFKS